MNSQQFVLLRENPGTSSRGRYREVPSSSELEREEMYRSRSSQGIVRGRVVVTNDGEHHREVPQSAGLEREDINRSRSSQGMARGRRVVSNDGQHQRPSYNRRGFQSSTRGSQNANSNVDTANSRRNYGSQNTNSSESRHGSQNSNLSEPRSNPNQNYSGNDSRQNKSRGFQREYPIGVKVMQSLLEEKEPFMIPIELLKKNSGYDILLDDSELRPFKIELVLKLLEKSLSTRANDEGVIDLLLKTFRNSNFCQKLMNFISEMKFETSNAKEYLFYIASIVAEFLRLSPANAYPLISNLVDVCTGVIIHLKREDPSSINGIEQAFENVQLQLKESRDKFLYTKKSSVAKNMAPPDNFREQAVIPTCEEVNAFGRPFIRPNVIEGKYENVDHYLDVQFRLLKEDFIRPLREGLQEYRKKNQKRNFDVRIYADVKVDSTAIDRNEYVYYLKLSLHKNFKIENSKRLMYGNIVCISTDNFETMITATIAGRDKLKEHLIAVKLETEPFKLDKGLKYTLIESRAYFVSYKHVLSALQTIRDIPLENYIVHVNETKAPPDYLQRFTTYEFKTGSKLNVEVPILDPIEYWPTCDELQMDKSQRRALHGALTRQLAIIQGPPGTGKTYLGLQITKVLLRNKTAWNSQKSHPILVVCYTNHALDQFLEGILSFTDNIVRVGSQSKNETLAQYQINKRIYSSSRTKDDDQISRVCYQLRDEIKSLQCIIEKTTDILKMLKRPGIISFITFEEFPPIIPPHLKAYIGRFTMKGFLTCVFDDDDRDMNDEMVFSRNDVVSDEETEEFYDVDEEILQEEEHDRLLDDIDDEPLPETVWKQLRMPFFEFEIDEKIINNEIRMLTSVIEEDPYSSNCRAYVEKVELLKLTDRAIQAGQKIAYTPEECKLLERYADINTIQFPQRWKLYKYWKSELKKHYRERLSHLETEHIKLSKSLMSAKDLQYLSFMKTVDIVGMTTTGAAQYCKILHDLAPPIVIVEEAAEILEAHLITSLSPHCKHLIIIGDHQQLRPKPNVYELETKYHLDTSFFERMIKNNIIYETLEYQHRMNPKISNLLVPTIYEGLKDHPSVFEYPKVKGITEDLFFLDHKVYENAPFEEVEQSYENSYEAEFLMGLCRHLIYQGYSSEDVTIITPYLGQFRCLKQLQRKREFYSCEGVRISILDNYQGEESNIILLSLVRSNESGKVGFVKIDNRVNVALSRAKHGMYVIGNMSQMTEASELWKKIKKKLVDGGNIGPELQLECQNHPDQIMKVKSLEDILFKSPEGGCKLPCSAYLPKCGHKCTRLCHIAEQDHSRTKCTRPCPKVICNLGHTCPGLCFQECTKCVVMIKKLLPCGHEHMVECYMKPEDFKCPTIVTRELRDCKHKQTMECCININTYKCKENCVVRLDCGHQCKNKCHVLKDPNHEQYDCHVPCDKNPENCEFNHKCRKRCYEACGPCTAKINRHMKCGHTLANINCGILEKDIKCPQKCGKALSCGHVCQKKCSEDCGGCGVIVEKTVPTCGHRIKIACSKSPTLLDCNGKCTKLLACQHRCMNKCKENCTSNCRQLVESQNKCPKGHKVKLPCHLANVTGSIFSKSPTDLLGKTVGDYCSEECGAKLDCDHYCKGKCGECFSGRLHATCKQKCNKTLVCGHVCTEPCSMDCPPCQNKCLWRCSHSQCRKKCGVPCINCQEQCDRQCPHASCTAKCGSSCTVTPCTQPCPKRLKKCGHECIGYCGEPCPKQCRICDEEEVAEILFGTEDDEDARFVLLEDCGHIIEGEGLDKWMKKEDENGKTQIGMKLCPKCSTPIYVTQRYQNEILNAYKDVMKVKRKHFTDKRTVNKFNLKQTLKDLANVFRDEINTLGDNLGFDMNLMPKKKQKEISDQQYILYEFQLNFLKSAKATKEKLVGKSSKLLSLIEMLMKYTLSISQQTMNEFSCELRRLDISFSVEKLRERVQPVSLSTFNSSFPPPINSMVTKIDAVMDPTIKFDKESESRVIAYLKEAEKYCGALGITNDERLQIIKAMGLSQGHWYACPNGHVYCITECGGATVESVCPECKVRIGGTNHRLLSNNRVATEMDGARRSAWPGGP